MKITSDSLMAFGALLVSLVALIWNMIRDLIVDRVNIRFDMRIGVRRPVAYTGGSVFVSISELEPIQVPLQVTFWITNVGRHDVLIEKIGGDLCDQKLPKPYFYYQAWALPKMLKPYETHSELSDNSALFTELISGKIKTIYAIDSKGERWKLPKGKIEKEVSEYKEWLKKIPANLPKS